MTDYYGYAWERDYGLCSKCGTRQPFKDLIPTTLITPPPAPYACLDTDWCFKQAVRREAERLTQK